MKMSKLLLVGAEIALVATGVLFIAFQDLYHTFVGVGCVLAAVAILVWLLHTPRRLSQISEDERIVGIGTVCHESERKAGKHQVTIEVTSVDGETFVGRLTHHDGDRVVSWLRPGTVLLVAFDPAAPEQLSLPDDVLAVRAAELTSI
ncbi:MAG: hypothetical protein QOH91_3374 [Mycobacterium sp.]|jgi:uncharacterized membrane protein|nr:hypothetical protein [Mycobacterium sp.]